METPKKRLERYKKGKSVLAKEIPDTMQSMFQFVEAAQKESALTAREKELIALGISLYQQCEDCIAVHVEKAFQVGCTRQEILEVAGMAMVFGGGPTLTSAATFLVEALDEIGEDFEK